MLYKLGLRPGKGGYMPSTMGSSFNLDTLEITKKLRRGTVLAMNIDLETVLVKNHLEQTL